MAIDIGYLFDTLKSTGLNYLGSTLKSTLWTSILIVIVVLIIVITMYPVDKHQSFNRHIRPCVYIFLFTMIILFIHDSFVQDSAKITQEDTSAEKAIGGIKLFGGRNNEDGGIYEAVYGTSEEDVKMRKHETVGNNAYVDKVVEEAVSEEPEKKE